MTSVITDDDKIWSMFHHNNDRVFKSHDEACEFCQESDSLMIIDGDNVCVSCGSVNQRMLDYSAEWRINLEDNKSVNLIRCGMPINSLMPDAMLTTQMGFGQNLKETYEMRIMRKYHMWNSTCYKERSLYNIFDQLSLNASNNGIPNSIIEEAKAIYKKANDIKILRGNNRAGLIATSVYMACKNNGVPRSTKEIAAFFNIKQHVISKSCKYFQAILKTNLQSTKPEDFIARFGSKINLTPKQKEICLFVIYKSEEMDIVSNHTPPSIAAAVIYTCNIWFNWNICKKDIANACDISLVTIVKCSKSIATIKDDVLQK